MSDEPSTPARDPRDAIFDVGGLHRGMGRKVGNASMVILAVSALKVLIQFGGLAILARLIPPAEYGVFALAMPAVGMAIVLSNFGLPQAIVQRRQLDHAQVSTLFWVGVTIAAAMAAMVAALGGAAARVFDLPALAALYPAVAVAIVFATMSGQYAAILRRRLRVRLSEMLLLGGEVVALAAAIAAALGGLGYWALAIQQIVAQAAGFSFLAIATGWAPSAPWLARLGPVRGALGFGGFVAGQSLLNQLLQYVGTVIAGAQLGPEPTGLFHRARNLGGLPSKRIMTPLSNAIVPSLSRLQDDPEAMRAMFTRLISRANLLQMPVAVVVAAGAGPIVALLLGPGWAAMAPLLAWMSLFTLRAGANHGLRYALMSTGHSRPLFVQTALRCAIVSTAIYLAAGHGLEAMVKAYVLSELFLTLPLMMAFAARYTPIGLGVIARTSLLDMGLAAVTAGALILWVNPRLEASPAIVHLAVLCALAGAVTGLRILATPGMRRDVRGVLARLATRLAPRAA